MFFVLLLLVFLLLPAFLLLFLLLPAFLLLALVLASSCPPAILYRSTVSWAESILGKKLSIWPFPY